MKSKVINIDSRGNGFGDAVEQTKEIAALAGLNQSESLDLQLLTEEMLSLVRSITGEIDALYWIESVYRAFELHMTTTVVMDKEKRRQLIESSTSRKNEASVGFLGKLRDAIEEAMTADVPQQDLNLSKEEIADLPQGMLGQEEWDGYERSILHTVADEIRVGIKGSNVEVTICKRFA